MAGCNQASVVSPTRRLKNLRGILKLDISECCQDTVTDAAFNNLRGIHTLSIASCQQEIITDAAFVNLRGIHTLNTCVFAISALSRTLCSRTCAEYSLSVMGCDEF